MWNTVLGSKRARGKKNRRNIRKFATRYPATQLQMIRLLIFPGWSFGSPSTEPTTEVGDAGFAAGAAGPAAFPVGFGGVSAGSTVRVFADTFASDSLISSISPFASEVGPRLTCGKPV